MYTDSSQQGDMAALSSPPAVSVLRIAFQDFTLGLAVIRISALYFEADEDSLVYGRRNDLTDLIFNTCLVLAKRETERETDRDTERYSERQRGTETQRERYTERNREGQSGTERYRERQRGTEWDREI